uniref:Uncharacterized protein n=1 Tax=Streptomyces variabilis TaxID=67372 RepID=A0A0U3SML0_9ACTN|nr:hypothetical protein [Streptomyces variabilis]
MSMAGRTVSSRPSSARVKAAFPRFIPVSRVQSSGRYVLVTRESAGRNDPARSKLDA